MDGVFELARHLRNGREHPCGELPRPRMQPRPFGGASDRSLSILRQDKQLQRS